MSQYYPQQSPYYQPPPVPESDYDYYDENDYDEYEEYEDDGTGQPDNLVQRILIFVAGGCLVFLCMSCCAFMAIALWVLDPGSSLVATPIPGSDIGLSIDSPAFFDEVVVNEKLVELAIQVNRNASLPTVPPVEGREVIIITVELANLGEEEVNYAERDFTLLNRLEEAYVPTMPGSSVIEGALGRGTLRAGDVVQGRLVFEVLAGEPLLVLAWDGGPDTTFRYIELPN